jgi:hypothetical protein
MHASGDSDAALYIGNAVVSCVRLDSGPQRFAVTQRRALSRFLGGHRLRSRLEIGWAKSLAYKGLRLTQNARVKVIAKHRMMVRPKSCIWEET